MAGAGIHSRSGIAREPAGERIPAAADPVRSGGQCRQVHDRKQRVINKVHQHKPPKKSIILNLL